MIDWTTAAAVWAAIAVLTALYALVAAVRGDLPATVRAAVLATISGACVAVWLALN